MFEYKGYVGPFDYDEGFGGTVEKTIASMKESRRFRLEGSREIPPGHSDAGDAVLVDVPPWSKVQSVPEEISRCIPHCGPDGRFQGTRGTPKLEIIHFRAKTQQFDPKTALTRKKRPRKTRKPRKSGKKPW